MNRKITLILALRIVVAGIAFGKAIEAQPGLVTPETGSRIEALRSFSQSFTATLSTNATDITVPKDQGRSFSIILAEYCWSRQQAGRWKETCQGTTNPADYVTATFAFTPMTDLVDASRIANELHITASANPGQRYLIVGLPGNSSECAKSFGSGTSGESSVTIRNVGSPRVSECRWSVAIGAKIPGSESGFKLLWSDTVDVKFAYPAKNAATPSPK